jgi:hypothetical protein
MLKPGAISSGAIAAIERTVKLYFNPELGPCTDYFRFHE